MQLLDLPLEILVAILNGFNTFTNIVLCQRVSRRPHEIITDCTSIQCTIQKDIAGIQDNLGCKLPTGDCIEVLLEMESWWACSEYSFKQKIAAYDVAPGVVLLGYSVSTNIFTTERVRPVRLPSAVDGLGSEPEWNATIVGEAILDFGTSIEEYGLLALVTWFVFRFCS